MEKNKVIIAGGGTAGHLYPGIAIARELLERRSDLEILFAIGGTPLELRILGRERFSTLTIRSGPLRGRGTFAKLKSLGRVAWGLGQSLAAIRRTRPRLVIGVGGYASGPMVLAGVLVRRPTLLHEQNLLPGLTNRLLAPLVDEVAISFAGTSSYLGGKGRWTGNPLRGEFRRPVEVHRPGGPLRLLVFGGSQGARRINQVFLEALPALISLPGGVEIVHATGEDDREWVEEAYREHGFPARVEAFLTEMAPAYATADLVISRAGATTCAELTALGKPAILIPFPRAAGGHQDLNAEQLREAGAAVMIPEPELGPERLAEMVRDLASEPDRLREMATASRSLGLPDAAKRVANLAEELMNARGKTAA